MATIDVRRAHKLTLAEAHAKAEEFAKGMEQKLSLQWHWEGENIKFTAPSGAAKGSTGTVSVSAQEVRVEIDLPFLLRAVKGTVEGKVKEKLDALLGPA